MCLKPLMIQNNLIKINAPGRDGSGILFIFPLKIKRYSAQQE
jgi:hypothetical protein